MSACEIPVTENCKSAMRMLLFPEMSLTQTTRTMDCHEMFGRHLTFTFCEYDIQRGNRGKRNAQNASLLDLLLIL